MKRHHLLTTLGLLLIFAPSARCDDKPAADAEIPKLIDQLVKFTDYRLLGIYGYGQGDTFFFPLDGKRDEGDFRLDGPPFRGYDAIRELVSRGPAAVPHLVAHLDDRRKTERDIPVRPFFCSYADEIDRNPRTDQPFSPPIDWTQSSSGSHEVTVGDLCFVILGQIVNRRYEILSGGKIGSIQSSTAGPNILARVRAAWKGLTPERLISSLIDDVRRPDDFARRVGAIKRLGYYFPDAHETAVLKLLADSICDDEVVDAFVNEKLFGATDQKAARTALDGFVAKHGQLYRQGVEQELFNQLRRLEESEQGYFDRPKFGSKPRDLLVQLFGHKPGVQSDDRPRFDGVFNHSLPDLISQALLHDRSRKLDLIVLGLLNGANENDDLSLACMKRLLGRGFDAQIEKVCKKRIEHIKDEKLRTEFRKMLERIGWTSLHVSAHRGDAFWIREDLKNPANLNAADKADQTPLHLAATAGHLDCVRLLVDGKASVDIKDANGLTAVQLAVRADHFDITKFLIDRGCKTPDTLVAAIAGRADLIKQFAAADPQAVRLATEKQRTALHLAAWNDRPAVAEALLAAGANIDAYRQFEGVTATHIAAASGREKLLQVLLRHKPNLRLYTEFGPALTLATQNGHTEALKMLLDAGADPNMKSSGWTPLQEAAEKGDVAMIDALLKHGAKVDEFVFVGFRENHTALHRAVRNNRMEAVKRLLDGKANVNASDVSGPPLVVAAGEGNLPMVKLLLERGAKIDGDPQNPDTPLAWAVGQEHIEVARYLLKHGAQVNHEKQKNYWSPLHSAATHGDLEMAKLLLSYGADRNARNFQGKTPLDLAREAKKQAMVQLLEKK